MKQNDRPSRAQGAALILVLVSLMALSGLILRTTEVITREFEDMSLLALEYKSGLKAQNGLEKGLNLLSRAVSAPDIRPGQGLESTWEEQGLRITVLPCSGKLDINALTRNPEDRERVKQALLTIFKTQDLTRTDLDRLLTWTGALKSGSRGPDHMDMQLALARRNRDYSAPGRALQRPEELLLVPGFEDLSPAWIRRFFTVWGPPGKINLNFAPQETAVALVPELEPYWDRIEAKRQKSGLTHPNQLLTAVGLDMATYSQILPFLIWEATRFEILIESREGSWYTKYRYIVQYDPVSSGFAPQVLARDVLQAEMR